MSAFILALPVGLLCLLVIWFAWQLHREQKLTEQWRALAKDWEAAYDGTFTTPEQSEYATFTPPASQPTVESLQIIITQLKKELHMKDEELSSLKKQVREFLVQLSTSGT